VTGPAPAPAPVMLRTRKLVKEYRADGLCVEALRGVDIELAFGEFVAVMGPSGSGKSTLLHVIGGLAAASSGEIWLRGQRVDVSPSATGRSSAAGTSATCSRPPTCCPP